MLGNDNYWGLYTSSIRSSAFLELDAVAGCCCRMCRRVRSGAWMQVLLQGAVARPLRQGAAAKCAL